MNTLKQLLTLLILFISITTYSQKHYAFSYILISENGEVVDVANTPSTYAPCYKDCYVNNDLLNRTHIVYLKVIYTELTTDINDPTCTYLSREIFMIIEANNAHEAEISSFYWLNFHLQ